MGTGAISVNGVDITTSIEVSTVSVEVTAKRLNSIAQFEVRDETAALSIRERHEVLVTDDGTRIFGGEIATITRDLDGKALIYKCRAVSFDTFLDQAVITSGARTGSRSDKDDVEFILGHSSKISTDYSFVAATIGNIGEDIDYTGKTLRAALDMLAGVIGGANYWIDENKKAHWLNPLSAQLISNMGWQPGSSGWTLDGAATRTADVGPGGTGDYALVTVGNGTGRHETTQTLTSGIVAGRRYLLTSDLRASTAGEAVVRIEWLTSVDVTISTDEMTSSGIAVNTWGRKRAILTAPATAAKAIVRLGCANNSTATVRHDNTMLVGETAAYGINTTPAPPVTEAPLDWSEPSDAAAPINRVFVQGEGVSGWREHAASIAYYNGTKFEGYVEDNRATTSAMLDSRAAFVFAQHAFPAKSGVYGNLRKVAPGTWPDDRGTGPWLH